MEPHSHHGESHVHGHSHGHHAPAHFGRAFAIGIALNLIYVTLEGAFGFMAHSLSLLADAGHNLGDVAALAAAWGSSVLATRQPSKRFTYGLRRSTILSALGNGVVLLIITGSIVGQAIERLFHPVAAGGRTVMIVAGIGILVNGATAWLFAAGREGDLNLRSAYLHMLADALVTAGVLLGGLAIWLTGWLWIDPAVSLGVSVVLILGTWSLLRDSAGLALDGVPGAIDCHAVEAYLRAMPGILEVHDLHIWALSTTETALTVHLVHDAEAEIAALLPRITRDVAERYHIGHATVQMETMAIAEACGLRSDHVV